MSRKQNIYDSLASCAASEGIDKKILVRAKNLGCPAARNSKFYWLEYLEWIKDPVNLANVNKKDADGKIPNSLADVKLENLIKDGKLKDLEIKKKQESLIGIDEVEAYLEALSTAQTGLFNRYSKELAVKLAGKSAPDIEKTLTVVFDEIIDVLRCDVSKWV